jgi:UDP-2,3-diacylglucosamine hydrolase
MAVLFISDLHLDPARPDGIAGFRDFCATTAREALALYILGDLFEAWIGDDDDDPALEPIVGALADLTARGTPCYFMQGNRDFLAGAGFARRTGCHLLGDFEKVDLYGRSVLLTHGDLLCTDDVRHQELRRQLRDPGWQRDFLAKTLHERRRIATELRQLSQTEMADKTEAIMDVNVATVRETMRRFGVHTLLHGHTHRPAIHRFDLDGRPAERIVLNDWYGPGGYLRWNRSGPTPESLRIQPG